MLNVTTINQTKEVARKIEVTEQRAPTDDSVRLYGEMRQKVLDELSERYQMASNELKVHWGVFQDFRGQEMKVHGRIVLNGHPVDFETVIREWEREPIKIIAEARKAIIGAISRVVLEDLFQSEHLRRICFNDKQQ